jgi:VCBS repeat-containing protein
MEEGKQRRMGIMDITEIERKEFEDWIKSNWDSMYHNFSIKKNGDYFYNAMEDAWAVWLGARGYVEVMRSEND